MDRPCSGAGRPPVVARSVLRADAVAGAGARGLGIDCDPELVATARAAADQEAADVAARLQFVAGDFCAAGVDWANTGTVVYVRASVLRSAAAARRARRGRGEGLCGGGSRPSTWAERHAVAAASPWRWPWQVHVAQPGGVPHAGAAKLALDVPVARGHTPRLLPQRRERGHPGTPATPRTTSPEPWPRGVSHQDAFGNALRTRTKNK